MRNTIGLGFVLLVLALSAPALAESATKRVLMMVPDDFMWPEYGTPRALYEKAGHRVTVAGRFPGEVKPDRRNKKDYPESGPVKVDLVFDRVNVQDYDAITFVAGNGAWHDFFPAEPVHKVLKSAFERKMLVGLICASTGLLGMVDNVDGDGKPLAEGRKVVGYWRVAGILKKLGRVNLVEGGKTEPGVAVDGKLVTGRNPESAELFGKAIVGELGR